MRLKEFFKKVWKTITLLTKLLGSATKCSVIKRWALKMQTDWSSEYRMWWRACCSNALLEKGRRITWEKLADKADFSSIHTDLTDKLNKRMLPSGFPMCLLSNNRVTEWEFVQSISGVKETIFCIASLPVTRRRQGVWARTKESYGLAPSTRDHRRQSGIPHLSSQCASFFMFMGSSSIMQCQPLQLWTGITTLGSSAIIFSQPSVENGLICCNMERSSVKATH